MGKMKPSAADRPHPFSSMPVAGVEKPAPARKRTDVAVPAAEALRAGKHLKAARQALDAATGESRAGLLERRAENTKVRTRLNTLTGRMRDLCKQIENLPIAIAAAEEAIEMEDSAENRGRLRRLEQQMDRAEHDLRETEALIEEFGSALDTGRAVGVPALPARKA